MLREPLLNAQDRSAAGGVTSSKPPWWEPEGSAAAAKHLALGSSLSVSLCLLRLAARRFRLRPELRRPVAALPLPLLICCWTWPASAFAPRICESSLAVSSSLRAVAPLGAAQKILLLPVSWRTACQLSTTLDRRRSVCDLMIAPRKCSEILQAVHLGQAQVFCRVTSLLDKLTALLSSDPDGSPLDTTLAARQCQGRLRRFRRCSRRFRARQKPFRVGLLPTSEEERPIAHLGGKPIGGMYCHALHGITS